MRSHKIKQCLAAIKDWFEDEEMEQWLEEEMEGREARIEEGLDFEASTGEPKERKVMEVEVLADGPATDQIVTSRMSFSQWAAT